ncbi:MAG: hypothetical protein WBA57_02855 [Elainellaceae cyanobacterium]
MSASSLQPMHDVCFYVSGQVTVHPDAAIAPHVLIQADPGSQIMIHAGVSLGSGTILHAHGGLLEIRENATVGNQVLIVGHGSIGESACIGAFSTLMMEIDVADRQVLPPSSLLGDISRKVIIEPSNQGDENSRQAQHHGSTVGSTVSDIDSESGTFSQNGDRPSAFKSEASEQKTEQNPAVDEAIAPDAPPSAAPQTGAKNGHVYGRAAFEQMISVMFPARQYQFGSGNGANPSNGASSSNGPKSGSSPSNTEPEQGKT